MYEMNTLKAKKTYKYGTASFILMLIVALYSFSPFTAVASMYGMVGDTAIQIKTGLDGISSGHLMLDEVYSWHPDLIWTAHEEGWYFFLGFMYKFLGLWGVILVGTIFNLGTGFICVKNLRDRVHPLISCVVLVLVPFLGGFPDYNVRPSVTSAFAIALLISIMLKEEGKPLNKALAFAGLAYALAWLHGGILPVFFMVMVVFAVVEILYKNKRAAITYLVSLPVAMGLTLINPIGIRIWTFGLKQMGADDIWQYVQEWQPHKFSIFAAIMVLVLLIGFMVDEKVVKFDKRKITAILILSMFFIATCKYTRFILYFSIAYIIFAPEEIEGLLLWINKHVFKIKLEKITISDASYRILTLACAVLILYSSFNYGTKYFKTNSMHDIEAMAAYDIEAVDYLKAKDYKKVFNTFNTGSWLAFYDVPVHIDNRIDPFMEEYSGVDHIRGKMNISNLYELESFRREYEPDAFILDMGTGESELLWEIENYASDRYKIVYDNTCSSNLTDSICIRWVIIECI